MQPNASKNVAARMGRWSARHRKIAIFGWLAFVVAAFLIGGMVGTKNIDYKTSGPGESGRADRILAAGFDQPAKEAVLIESPDYVVTDPEFSGACPGGRVEPRPSMADVDQPPLAVRSGQRRGRSPPAKHAALVIVRHPRGYRRRGRQDRPDRSPQVAAIQEAHPDVYVAAVRRHERQRGARGVLRQGSQEGRAVRRAADARDPRVRLRCRRRGARAAAARALGRRRGDRPDLAIASQLMPIDNIALPRSC